MLLLRLYSILSLFLASLSGGVLSYDELKDKPKGLVKDYYIHRLANEMAMTKEQALELSKHIFRSTGAVKKSLDKIAVPKAKSGICDRYGVKNILDANTTCQNELTNMSFSLKLDRKTREIISLNLKNRYPKKSKILLILNDKNPALSFSLSKDTSSFIALFNASNNELKNRYFQSEFDKEFMDSLYHTKGFSHILNGLVLDGKFNKFRENFIKINPEITEKKDAFFLGLNALTLGFYDNAREFFKRADKTYEYQRQRDNSKFWLYLLGDRQILKDIANSSDINIYSLYAKELLNDKPFEVYVPKPAVKNANEPDITDPFLWQYLVDSTKNMDKDSLINFANKFYTKDSVSAYVYFINRANSYKKHYYIVPESESLNDINSTRKSLIFALARQESLFLPAVVSTSYALGTMQFMPFLANAVGKKELKIENFDQDDMFKPNVAYKFANHHLNYLEKFLHHPLFIAYAYNGGIGFTKRFITKDNVFKSKKFEPFLSMELVPYAETRLYGKKVLANYVIYMALSGSNIKISQLFESLSKPALTDKFRKP